MRRRPWRGLVQHGPTGDVHSGATALSTHLLTTIKDLAVLGPATLAVMHGSTCTGDGGARLHALARGYGEPICEALTWWVSPSPVRRSLAGRLRRRSMSGSTSIVERGKRRLTPMEILNDEFAQAKRNVTVHGEKRDHAIAAHTEVRELLKDDAELNSWGIDALLIGSYGRQTARYPGKDVDMFLRFSSLSVRHSPEKIYDAVERVLVEEYGLKDDGEGGRITRQSRSLKIDFPDPDDHYNEVSFAIDAVPAVPWGDHWAIPNRDRDKWDNDDKRWIKTDPVQFAADTNSLATAPWSPVVGTTNAYRPIVRLLRQARHNNLGGQRPGGLFVEIAAYYAWKDQLVTGDSWAELLASTFEHVGARLTASASDGLPDPVLGTPLKPELDHWQWTNAGCTFTRLAEEARAALDADKCRAAKIWRDILGDNERGPVLPVPEGCDAAGYPVGSITAVGTLGSNRSRGFAAPSRCCAHG